MVGDPGSQKFCSVAGKWLCQGSREIARALCFSSWYLNIFVWTCLSTCITVPVPDVLLEGVGSTQGVRCVRVLDSSVPEAESSLKDASIQPVTLLPAGLGILFRQQMPLQELNAIPGLYSKGSKHRQDLLPLWALPWINLITHLIDFLSSLSKETSANNPLTLQTAVCN